MVASGTFSAPEPERSWPELQEELARKALETLQQALHQVDEGELSEDQLLIVVNTLVETIQGLVPWDVTDTIYAVRKAIERERNPKPRRRR
jgi:hypothetical protein